MNPTNSGVPSHDSIKVSMSSKWASDSDGKDDGGGNGSPLTPNSPPSEQKEVTGGRRSRRPRPGRGDADMTGSSKDDVDRPQIKAVAGG